MSHRHGERGARKSWSELWDAGKFGPDGPFGRDGPFGPTGPFGPDGPFGPGGPFGTTGKSGRGPRRRRMFGHGELRLALLKLLADEARHGYELIKWIEDLTGGAYTPSPGAVYPTLQLLADEGAIEERDDDSPRKAFTATEQGRAELADRADEVEALFERLGEHGRTAEKRRSPQLVRAMGNLGHVLKHRVRSGEMDDAAVEQIVDLIDELAKKIERL